MGSSGRGYGREEGGVLVLYEMVLTAVVFLGVALLILLFERRRAQGIERDLREMDARRHADRISKSRKSG